MTRRRRPALILTPDQAGQASIAVRRAATEIPAGLSLHSRLLALAEILRTHETDLEEWMKEASR